MKTPRNVQSAGMNCSVFVDRRWMFVSPATGFLLSVQIIRECTINELSSIRVKSAKTSSVDLKYQESLKLFKVIVEQANARR